MESITLRTIKKLSTPVTRDSFTTWDMNNRSFYRQFPEFRAFLPGGTMPKWTSFSVDPTSGINIMKPEGANQVLDVVKTDKARSDLEEFLLHMGSSCPEHYISMVRLDCDSYEWMLKPSRTHTS